MATPVRALPSPSMIPITPVKEHMLVSSWRDAAPMLPPSPMLPPAVTATPAMINPAKGGPTQPSTCPSKRKKKKSFGPNASAKGPDASGGDGGLYAVRVIAPDNAVLKTLQDIAASLRISILEVITLPATYTLKIKRTDAAKGGLTSLTTTPVGSDLTSPESVPNGFDMDLGNDSFEKPLALPPSAAAAEEEASQVLVAVVPSEAEATTLCDKMKTTSHTASVVSRGADESRSPTLVLKGVPFAVRADRLMDELNQFPWPPSYVRFHFSDRGMFKGIAYVKYKNRDDSERAKMVLERLRIGTKPLKVEYRKATQTASVQPPQASPSLSPFIKSKDDISKEVCAQLEAQLSALIVSKDAAGLSYSRANLTREEQKFVKQTCEKLGLEVELTPDVVRVLRDPSTLPPPRVSPSLAPRTPPTVPANPNACDGVVFRGVDHWKGVGAAHAQKLLPVMMAKSPTDAGAVPFPIGRGKPIKP